MTIKQALRQTKDSLQYVCKRPLFEAEILLAHHLGKNRTYLRLYDNTQLEHVEEFEALVDRRAAHEPMEYITGRVSFYDIDLYIAPGALIPRPETEILVEKVAQVIAAEGYSSVAEIGIGSGAISVVLARQFPQLHIIASDISEDALAIARANIEEFGLSGQIELQHTSLLDGIDRQIDLIVSNPPYIAKYTPLSPNVAEYEPHTALYSEEQGDELLKEIIMLAKERGVKYLACEMGYDQREPMAAFVKEMGDNTIDFYTDLAGLDRGFVMRFVQSINYIGNCI